MSGSRLVRMALRPLPKCLRTLERVKGIEPSSSAWKAVALPLSYTRIRNQLSGISDQNLQPVRPDTWPLIPAGGGGRTRTYEGVSQRIYSPPPLPLGTLPRCGLVKHSQFPKQWPIGGNGRIGKRLPRQ